LGRAAELSWSTALPDWHERIRAGRSLVPRLPLIEAEAARPEVAWCVANQPIVNMSNRATRTGGCSTRQARPGRAIDPGRWQKTARRRGAVWRLPWARAPTNGTGRLDGAAVA
jgi:hypothetical protein